MISDYKLKALNCVKGIDVSSYQKNVDWQKAYELDNIRFAFVKISEDIYSDSIYYPVDNPLEGRCREIKAQDIKLGYYHFARPGNRPSPLADATAEADQFLGYISKLPIPDFPIVLDLEEFSARNCWSANLKSKYLKTYIQGFNDVLKSSNFEMLIYSSQYFLNTNIPDFHEFNQWPIWIANYVNSEVHLPAMPENYKPDQWNIWQYSRDGIIDASHDPVDLDIMTLDYYNAY